MKILILTADAGFGHRSAANAINNAIEECFPEKYEVELVNPLDRKNAPFFIRESQSEYDKWVKNVPELYKFGYDISDAPIPVSILEAILTVSLFEVIKDTILEYQPDIVVNTYPLYQAPFVAVRSLHNLDIPLVTIVTDLATVHHIWFNEKVDLLIVPTEIVKEDAIEAGVDQKKVFEIGIPVNPEIFLLKEKKRDIKKRFGWQEDLITILAVGSKRVEHFMENLNILNHSGFDFQLVVVCGKDKKIYDELQKVEWHHPVFLYEFVDNMPEFLRASDILISKAGGLIVTEALASGLPIIIVDAIPGQETGNAKFVQNTQAGYWVKNPYEFLETMCHLLQHNYKELEKLHQNAKQHGKPTSALKIIELIDKHFGEKKFKSTSKSDFIKRIEKLLLENQIPWNQD